MHQRNAQSGTDVLDALAAVAGPVVHIELLGFAASRNGMLQGVFETGRCLAQVELRIGDESRVVIENGKEVGLAAFASFSHDQWAMTDIALPEGVGVFCFEFAPVLIIGIALWLWQ